MTQKAVLLSFALAFIAACSIKESADTVYLGGKVYTVNEDQPWAEAVAIRGDEILFVGSDADVEGLIGPETAVYDLSGKMMLPGFQDGHIHPISSAIDILNCSLYDVWTLEEYLDILAECAEARPDAEWIRGAGWSMDVFGPGAMASKELLDNVVADRPVYLESKDGHTGWVNSKALDVMGIDNDTPDPPNGIIDRDPVTGEAIGSLQEDAIELAYDVLPMRTLEEYIEALSYARDMLHEIGITAMQIGYGEEQDLKAYLALDDADNLGLRVLATLYWNDVAEADLLPALLNLREQYTRGNVRPIAIKIFQDGVLENYTGGVLEPYRTQEGGNGMEVFEPQALNGLVTMLDAAGFQVKCHAIGDRATRQCLDAAEAARQANGDLGHRHTIVHLQLIHPDDYERFGELDVVANFQPYWALADEYVTELVKPFVSAETYERQYPIRSILDAGGHVAFGSDWSVSSADPMLGIETAMTRLDPMDYDYPVLNAAEAITLEEAIRAFTIDAAYQLHHEDRTGSIEAGKLADLVVLDKNLFDVEPKKINEVKVVLTLFGGKPVFGDQAEL